ncbi:MAG: hypothetical protein IT174_08565 [Acidobacteria bacterium]|nr:hypothetical protein [Acidobacteriota bacterium]
MKIEPLRQLMDDWEDPDITKYYIACVLGLFAYDADFVEFRKQKQIFWTVNPTGIVLDEITRILVSHKFLEFDDQESKFRWRN